jgi:hypothetical protein
MKTLIKKINTLHIIAAVLLTAVLLAPACKKSKCTTDNRFPYNCKLGMDVAFLVDYTGSMGGVIDNIKTNVSNIVSNIVAKSGGDYRLSLSIFDENTTAGAALPYVGLGAYTSLPAAQRIINATNASRRQYLTMMEPFGSANQISFTNQLAKLNTAAAPGPMPLGFGIGGPEPGGLLADRIINANFAGPWRAGKVKLLIIITDAVDGGDDDAATALDDTYLANLATQANANQIQCMLITSLAASNYKTHLINNNAASYSLMSANFANIAPQVNNAIDSLCINNLVFKP